MGLIFKIIELEYFQYQHSGTKVHFHYILDSERSNPIISNSVVSDYSNAPYDRITYTK
jgi:hypothetical protein